MSMCRGTVLRCLDYASIRGSLRRVPDMQLGHAKSEPVIAWWLDADLVGQSLRERYEVPKELPPKLAWLVRKLDDDRDWLFPSVSWQKDRDLFLG
jgi:hypothetical protein